MARTGNPRAPATRAHRQPARTGNPRAPATRAHRQPARTGNPPAPATPPPAPPAPPTPAPATPAPATAALTSLEPSIHTAGGGRAGTHVICGVFMRTSVASGL